MHVTQKMYHVAYSYDEKYKNIIVHGIGAKLGSNREKNMLYTKSEQMFFRKKISMLTDLKVSSLACKCVFHRPEHNAKRIPHGTEF